MTTPRPRTLFTIVMSASLTTATLYAQTPVGTAFTYQGQLKDGGLPAEGSYDFWFRLYDDPNAGAQVGGDAYADDWLVSGGLFNVELDFGAVFTGDALWLEIAVRPWDSVNPYTVLSPRQPLTASPYALYALNSPASPGLWSESGVDIYYDAGRVGIGTDDPTYPVHVHSSGNGATLFAYNAGIGPAIAAASNRTVISASGASQADSKAIYAETANPDGFALYGLNEGEDGNSCAVYGETLCTTGFGGYFIGRGYFSGNVGIGEVNPQARLHIGGTAGVDGLMFPDGTVQTTAASGVGSLWTPDANDIYYDAGNVGVGISSPGYPLHVQSSRPSTAMRVEVTATTGSARALYGETFSPGGAGVSGNAQAGTGYACGVEGGSQSPDGAGVFGYNDADAGNAIAVRGATSSETGFGGYFDGRGYFSSYLGLGTTSPQSRLHIVGPDHAQASALITLEADTSDSVESGRLRFGESTGDMRGAFVHYDGVQNTLNLGTHQTADSDPANDVNAITISRATGSVGVNREAPAWPLHVGGEAHFEEHVGIGDSTYSGKLAVATDSDSLAISAENNTAGGFGLYGVASGGSGGTVGVEGVATGSPDGIGIKGTGYAIGVRGEAMDAAGYAGYFEGNGYFSDYVGIGVTNPTARLHIGGYPGTDGIRFPDDTLLKTAYPLWKESTGGSTYYLNDVGIGTDSPQSRLHVVGNRYDGHGVYAEIDAPFEGDMSAVRGVATTEGDWWRAIGVCGLGIGETGIGVQGEGDWVGVKGACVDGFCGVYALSYAPLTDALLAIAVDPGDEAGEFWGNVDVFGNLTKSGGSFKIDHPLDPENKYLYHSFVESPDMMNIYNGNVVTDELGYATIKMPEWFEALNRDFRYQLTVVDEADSDAFVLAKVVRKITDNCFTIRTSAPNVEVSWQVTGIRQDAWAEAHRIPVEEDKPSNERDYYLHPEVYGQTIEESIKWQQLPPREQEEIRAHLAGSEDRR